MNNPEGKQTELIEKINNSQVFLLDERKDPTLFQVRLYELITDVYEYLNMLSSKYTDFSVEVVEIIYSCLKTYNRDRGPFLHYYTAALANRLKAAEYDNYERNIIDHIKQDADGEPYDIFDTLASAGLEDEVIQADSLQDILQAVEVVFIDCNESMKKVVSLMLTAKILNLFPEGIDYCKGRYMFWNEELVRLSALLEKRLTAREISSMVGRNEASVSRTYHRFIENVREYYYGYRNKH